MFRKVLIANRGEIACRIIRTLRRLGVKSVAVYSEADRASRHVFEADEAVAIGEAAAAHSYLNAARVIEAAVATGSEAIHPGYGFLSENTAFAEAAEAAGIRFIGPSPAQIRSFGLKHEARELAVRAGVPLLPGSGVLPSVTVALSEAERIGYPLMLKSSAGGGGIGMQLCHGPDDLKRAFDSVQRLGRNNFGDASVFVERYVQRARHIEVQVFGDGLGNVVSLGERDCSAQRRNQKVVEECPAWGLTDELRALLHESAVRLCKSVGYRSAGTVEFVFDVDRNEAYFLEVNTRLQVEHGVTEAVLGIDLVEWMIRVAAGEPPDLVAFRPAPSGHAIEVRLYAEDPARDFKPSSGVLTDVAFPKDARVDTWVEAGTEVSPYYDPLVAKLIVHGEHRAQAISKLQHALEATTLAGIETNLSYLRALARESTFERGLVTTQYLRQFAFDSSTFEVLAPGTQTLVMDYPGRLGYWDVGIPPSGPMDALAFRLANRIVGNAEAAAALELTVVGPKLKFATAAIVALTGARMHATLDGEPAPYHRPISVQPGQVLELGKIAGAGCRAYLAVRGGIAVPSYLGSKTTFTLGGFGGHAGRALRIGDVLHIGSDVAGQPCADLPHELVPTYGDSWRIGVLYGPHGAPDFFTPSDIERLFSARFEVHYNSARTGVRLIGPKPEWARLDGGEAGLHPSNIHDVPYAIGAIDFTGDMPILLGPDGPSLGGFVCPAVVAKAEVWKLGQLRPGDTVEFVPITLGTAAALEQEQERALRDLAASRPPVTIGAGAPEPAIVRREPATSANVEVVIRRAGDGYLLVEYGPPVLDLKLRFRVHALMTWLAEQALSGIIDLTPGVRSLQIHYDPSRLSHARLLDVLACAERELPSLETAKVPTRTVHLPLSWDDPATQLAIQKYVQSVRPDAPWAPSNIEFIRRINGLDSIEDVRRIVFDASYLVLGLGDVYLGAPVATPLDPRHRLVTTKYNPARTWTPENAVGIGGAYMCIYGMEGPGGYQFVGRTLQVYNRYKSTDVFQAGKPWLLRFFDQIRFYPVSAAELLEMRAAFPHGRVPVRIESSTFRLADYERFLLDHHSEISAFKHTQQSAFEAERQRWIENGQLGFTSDAALGTPVESGPALPDGHHAVESHIPGSIWKVAVAPGDRVKRGDPLIIVESMKMEIAVEAATDGTVIDLCVAVGKPVVPGQRLAVIRELSA